jgi:phosphatidylinositol alpha 1,6-mannosyltransferase
VEELIVHVTDCFHPRLGGIEMQVSDLARAQRMAGETVHVITATPAGAGEPEFGPPVHRIVAPLPWELPVHPRAGSHLNRLLRDLHPDVVHVHLGAVAPFAWSAIRCAVDLGLPTVLTVHSMWNRPTRSLYHLFDGLTRRSASPLIVTAVSRAAADLVERAVPHVTVTVVPNGITPQEWRSAQRPDDHASGAVHVVAVGRLTPGKQPLALLKVLRSARDRLDGAVRLRATVAGSGPTLPAMRRYLRRHGMTDWVCLPGRLDRAEVRALLGTADVFVNPTAREAFGIATLEARTSGVPVVARTGTGVADYVVSGREGLLCDGTAGLIDGLTRLARSDDIRRTIMAHNRASEPAQCAWPAVTAAFRDCYDRAAALATATR